MTTICVVKKYHKVAIAADTRTKWGESKDSAPYVVNHSKIIAFGGGWMAIAGPSAAKLALKRYFLSKPEISLRDVDAIYDAWLDLHEHLRADHYLNPGNDEQDDFESSKMDVLIANPSGIFGVSRNRAVQEFSSFYAYGRGNEYAMGAMFAHYGGSNVSALDVAVIGVTAAAEFEDTTGLPVISYTVAMDAG